VHAVLMYYGGTLVNLDKGMYVMICAHLDCNLNKHYEVASFRKSVCALTH
jgi:hypothetical protein